MCNGASSRGSLPWYRPTSEKWHASMFRKPDMTAGYIVSLLHRCTTALGKKRHQSYSSARRQRRIISGKVFTASVKKKEAMPRKAGCWEKPRRPFLWRKFTSGVTDGACWGKPCRSCAGEPGPPQPMDRAGQVIHSALQLGQAISDAQ